MKNLPALAALALLAAAPWWAQRPPQAASPGASPAARPAGSALRAYIDPATGRRREPTAVELAAEAARANAAGGTRVDTLQATLPQAAPAAPADEIRLPDGTVGVRMPRRALHVVVLCRQAGGRYAEGCPQGGVAP